MDDKGRLKRSAMDAALACLARFRERLSGLHPSAVRVVATNTFRVAKNAREFLKEAERTLGLPIDIISGHEEARLTFFGVAHELPRSPVPRLVIDIGGGSTEFIIGRGFEPERLESLAIGCVSMTQRFFRDGAITAAAMDAAETTARAEIEAISGTFGPDQWREAYGSSGTAVALADILEKNSFSGGGITPAGLARLKRRMLDAGHVSRLKLEALKGERAPVLAGGLAIMTAAVAEIRAERIDPVGGALRLGVLYDLLGRSTNDDARAATVERFIVRYGIDRAQAQRRERACERALPPRGSRTRRDPREARRVGGPVA
jgi:exopolyphosphatase/guanosine-5'-triphosphate,3'-diphosphate pyrophosphatase